MANTPDQNQDPISLAWNKSRQLRDELAAKAGKPDNLETGVGDALLGFTGTILTNTGSAIKNLSLGDVSRAMRATADGSYMQGIADSAVDMVTGGDIQETREQGKGLLTDALGLGGVQFVGVDPSKNTVKEAVGNVIGKAASAGTAVADSIDQNIVKPVAEPVGKAIQSVGEGLKNLRSDDAKLADQSKFFTQDEDGNYHFGDAWSDPAKFVTRAVDVFGSLAPTILSGLITKGAVAPMVTKSMLKRGLSAEAAAVIGKATADRVAKNVVLAGGVGMSVGQSKDQAREAVSGLSYEELMSSPTFRENVRLVNEDPSNQTLSSTQRLEFARERTAEQAASYAGSDPTTYAGAVAGTVLGDAYLFKMITGKKEAAQVTGNILARTAKGFFKGGVGEGTGEAIEEGLQKNIANRASNEVGGTNIDPWEGAGLAALEAGTLGVLTGGAVGSVSADIHGSSKPAADTTTNTATPPTGPQTTTPSNVAGEVDVNTAIKEVSEGRKVAGSFSIGKGPEGYRAAYINQGGELRVTQPFATAEEAQQAAIQTTQPLRAEAPQQAAAQPTPDQAMQQTDDLANIPAFMRNGQELSPELKQARNQAMNNAWQDAQAQQAKTEPGVMQPREKTVTGNPDEPAFLRTQQNNPTGRDTSALQDADPYTQAQAALAKGGAPTADDLIQQSIQNGNQGKTPQEAGLTGDLLLAKQQPGVPATTEQSSGATVDGQTNEVIPESRGLGYNNQINMPGEAGNGINDNYVPPVTRSRQTADKSLGAESTRDPRSPVAQSIESAGQQADAVFNELKSLRVTKRGKPFGSIKEAQLASRKTETPIALPTGGFGVVDKAELEQAQAIQAPAATVTNDNINTLGVNDTNASDINQPADSAIKNVLGVKTEKQSNNDGSSTYRFSFNDGHASVLTHSDGTAHIMDVQIGDGETAGLRGKGVGTKLYEHIGNELAKDGVTLESTRWSKHKSAISPAALRVWEKLEKAGAARVVGHENARVLDRFSGVNEVRDIPIYEFISAGKEASQSLVKQIDASESASTPVIAQNQPDINANESSNGQANANQPIADQAVGTPSPETVTAPVVAKESQPMPAKQPMPAPAQQQTSSQPVSENQTNQSKAKQLESNEYLGMPVNELERIRRNSEVERQQEISALESKAERAPSETNLAIESDEINSKFKARRIKIESAIKAAKSDQQPGSAITPEPAATTPEIIEHKTGKGKAIRGVVRTDLSVDEAKAIDPFTFKKDGGYFIREKHLDKLPTKPVETSTEPTKVESQPEPEATTAKNDIASVIKDGMDAADLVNWIAKNSENESYREIAKRIAASIPDGIDVMVVKAGEKLRKEVPTSMNISHGMYWTKGDQKTLILKDSSFGEEHGLNEETALHELIHAATMRAIREGNLVKADRENPELSKAVADLYALQKAVVKHLDETQADIGLAKSMAASQVKELVAWGMTNKEFQDILQKIPYEKQSAWNKFVSLVGKLLGISHFDNTALGELIRVTDKILSAADGKPTETVQEQSVKPSKEQFADNKLFTADKVAAARARLKSKMGNLNSGLDPEIMIDGMTIAGAYIESGIRNFSTYAKAMTDDFGDGIKPFLLSFWEGARNYPGLDTQSMTSVEDAAKQHAELMSKKAETKAKPEADNKAGTERQILRDGIHSKMANGELISNNNTLKRVAAELLGISTGDLSTLQLKEAQEAYEVAAVRHRRDTIISTFNEGGSVKVAFDLAVSDYEAQPNLDVRTAKSSDMQAYSTPTPMALLANIAADVWSGKTVFEPTAGNGLLLLTADSKTTYANELDTDRADSLAWSGFNVTVQDATNNPLEGMIPAKVDAVVANPPFGKYRDDNGKPARVEFEDNQGRAYSFGEIDHIIAKNALDGMKDDGKATLILGAPKEAGDYTGNNKTFLNWLYSNYNVVHHIEANGDLYKGQGAGWPTQMIVIHGRAKDGTGKFAPFKGEIQRLNSWDAIYDSFNKQGLLDTKGAVFSQTTGNGNMHQGYEPVTDLSASQRVSNRGSGVDDLGNGRLGAGKPGRATGNTRSGQHGNGSVPAGTFDSQPDLSRHELEPTESRSTTNTGNTEPDKRSDRVGLSGQRNGDAVADYQKKEISSAITKVNDFQAEYKTASEGFNDGVLTPVNMASYTQTALASIQDRHGSIDKFVADRLGYKSKPELQKAFMGLQADAVALAVDAIEKGRAIIIGDQTGVGKGRQAAGVIRYALEQNKTPIFVTQKPNLFTDMYDDLADIGVKNFKPLIVNQENEFISKGDKTLFNMGTKERQTALNHILKTGQLPDGHNALFLTYSQISSDKNGNKVGLISKLAKNAIMVMDESHTAAGQDSKLGLAFQELVNNVHGLVYLSATYAKRPDNMLLYTRTDLGHAVDNCEALVSIISNGGLGMQTYIAGKLAEAGQMVRRERSFDGIEIKNRIIDDKGGDIKRGFDQATTALRAIQDLSAAWRNYVDDVLAKKIQMESGMDTRIAGNQADTKVDVTLFSSVVHNYIAQLSLGLKAKETAKLAIEAINRGERPVIALENTMGSALSDYMARTGRRIGDSASDLTYSSLLKSVADGSLAYLVKEAGAKKGEKTYVNIKDIHDPLIQNLYSQVMDAADAMKMDIPASPIDAIRHEIEKAGYTVAEITGRDLMVDYANGSEIKKRPADEKNRRRIVDNFNSKKLDVLILNQAGSTGLSIHASEKFADKSPRHMIVAQPSLDINTFLQMLGRVNRTGQVALPSYSLAWLDLPSEKRPASVLSRKMSSLNANTSGNADSATSIDAVDILNPYGDQVVTSFVEANRELLEQYNPRLVNLPQGDEATYFLGKLAVLPSDVAEQVIGQIEKDYNDLISYLDATGQNELNTKEVDLDAQPVSQRVVSEGRKNAGVFSEPTYATKVDVKAQGKAPKWDEVESALKESSQADFDEAINRMKADNGFANRLQERLKKAQSELDIRKVEGKSTKSEVEKVESIKQLISSHEAEKNNLEYLFSPRGTYHHGAVLRVRLPDLEESVTGILTGLNFENDGGNPAAKSKWRMKIMVADRLRQLPINLSQAESGVIEGGRQDNRYNLQAIFDRAAAMPSREHRYIMTGNLVEAQNRSTEKGRIIPFTTADGRVIQGMLMPKKFDPAAGSIKEEAKVTSTQAFNWLTNTEDKTAASLGLRTPDGDVVLRRLYNGSYELELPKAVSKGKKYWGNPSMVDIIGEQAVKGNGKLNIRLSIEEAKAVNKVMSNINPMTITNQAQIADYNRMTGKKIPTFSDTNIKFSKVPMNEAEQAGKGMKAGEAMLAAKEWLRQFKTDIQVKVARNQAEFNQMMKDLGQSTVSAGEVANAAYIASSKTLILNASAIQNPARLRQLMRHEILGHHGLEYVIGKGVVNDILQILKNGYATSKAIRDAVDTVSANYADADADTQIKEAFAHYAENRPVDKGPLGRLWQRIVSMVKSALQKVKFISVNESEQQLDSVLHAIAKNMRKGIEDGVMAERSSDAMFSRSSTADDELMTKLGLGPKPGLSEKTKAQLDTLRQSDMNTVKSWITRMKRKSNTEILDALAPIKYAEDSAGKLDASDSGYVAARMAAGSSSVMQATMLYGIPEWKDGVIQRKAGTNEKDSMLGIFEGLGSDLHNWLGWMAGHRAEILMKEGRENLLTNDDIAALKAKGIGKEAAFMAAKEKWNKLNGAMLDMAQEAGLFTAEDRAKFESEWYVPFFREAEDGDVMGPFKKNGIANQSAGIKQLKGGTANVNDILENIFQTTSKLIDSSMKNMAAQKVVHNLAETDLISIIDKPNLIDIKAAAQNKQNMMMVKVDGESHVVQVNDPALFKAMTMIDSVIERDPFTKAAMKAKHLITAGVTSGPEFMLRNFLRDAASTWAINEDGFKPMIDSIRGVKKAWKMDDSSINMMFSGASFMGGNLRGTDPEAMASVIRKTLRRKGMSPEKINEYENSLITTGRKAKDVLLHSWEQYERFGEAVENGSREAVYEAAIKAGKSHAQAAFEARDLMDFSMRGSSKIMRWLVDVLPFFNARMQGLGKLGRAMAANPKQIAKRGGMIAAASLALLAMNWDDDRYNDLPDWDKDMNWHFWLGDQHFRIPKPFEIGLMFGTLPERMVRTMGGKDTAGKFGQVVARNILETFSINPIPQVVKPLTESYFNYDMFRGAPIENMSDLNVAPEARYDERTSLLMRELGQITGLSPKKLEHIVTGYTGTIGAYVVGICDAIVRASGDYGAAPAIRADQIPVLKSIYQGSAPAKSSQAMTDFYQLLDEANQVYSTIRQYQKEGRMGDAQEMLEENRNKLAGRKTMTNAQKQFRQIRNEMELIQRDRNLNSDEKRERIDRLLSKRNNFAAKLIKLFGTEL